MTRLNVNPTRAELKNLKKRLQIAARGHKLLKEKQDSLIRNFMKFVEETNHQRKIVDDLMRQLAHDYHLASLVSSDMFLEASLNTQEDVLDIDISVNSILGIKVPKLSLQNDIQGSFNTSYMLAPIELDSILTKRQLVAREIIKLAQVEKQCTLMAEEIITTKRRVNSLEFKTIPDLEETISYIKMKIDDTERNQIAKVMQL